MTTLSQRKIDILQILSEKEYATADYIAEIIHVSAKTIRNEITFINEEFPDSIISVMSLGYQINKSCKDYDTLESQVFNMDDFNRKFQLLKKVLGNKSINFNDLCIEMFASESSILRAIDDLNGVVKKRYPNIQIKKRGDNIFLNATEDERRNISTYFFSSELNQYDFNIENYQSFFKTIDLHHIHAYTLAFLHIHKISLKDIEVMSLVIHVSIMTERIVQGNTVTSFVRQNEIEDKYELANEYYKGLLPITNVEFNENEINYLATLLAGKLPIIRNRKIKKMYNFTIKTLESVNEVYNINLLDDQKLIDNLVVHFLGLERRIATNSYLNNPLINDIKRNFPFLYAIFKISADLGSSVPEMVQ